MKNLKFYIYMAVALCLANPVFAQMLEDEVSQEETSEYDTLFNEMYSDSEKDNTEDLSTLENVASTISVKIAETKETEKKEEESKKNIPPLEGSIDIGISKGSFRVFQDILGRTSCTFGVTLKSNLSRDIRSIALRLVYQQRAFAFIYKDIKAGGASEKYISTRGDICYNLSGVPDIDINRCRIFGSKEDECAKRIKWDSEIISPDPSKNPYL